MGRLHPKKQLELLIEAFLEATRPALSAWKLLIAGDGDAAYVASLQQLAEKLGGKDKVVFPGWLTGEKKKQALQGAGVFALISRQENFGIAAAEAMACGVPVLLSEHVNLAAEVREAGCGWVTALDKNSVVTSLTEALTQQELRKAWGASARNLAEQNYRWPVVAERLAELYAQVLSEFHHQDRQTS
jgi:glycosyltransferase involved in cell wall biosynthesis